MAPFFHGRVASARCALTVVGVQIWAYGHRMVMEESIVRARVAGRRVFDANWVEIATAD